MGKILGNHIPINFKKCHPNSYWMTFFFFFLVFIFKNNKKLLNKHMRRTIRLRDGELRRMISESVKRVLNEDNIHQVYHDRMSSFEKQMQKLDWQIQDKERELKELKDQLDSLYNEYQQESENYDARWGIYS